MDEQRRLRAAVPPAYLGVAFLFSWTYLLFYACTAGIEASAPISLMSTPYLISSITMVVTLFVLAFSRIDRVGFLTLSAIKMLVPVVMAASSALILYATFHMQHLALIWVSGIATGVSSGLLSQQWVMVYRHVGLKVSLNSFPALMALSVTFCLTVLYFPTPVVYAAIVVCPIISEFLLHVVRKEPWPSDIIEHRLMDKPLYYVLFLFPFVIYALSSGFFDFFSASSNYAFLFYAFTAFIPLVAVGIFILVNYRSNALSLLGVPIAFIVVTVIPLITSVQNAPSAQFITLGELGMEVLEFLAIVGFSDFFSIDVFKVNSLTRLVIVALNSVGWYAGLYASFAYDELWNSQVSLVVVMICVEVFAVFLVWAIYKVQKQAPDIDEDEAGTSSIPPVPQGETSKAEQPPSTVTAHETEQSWELCCDEVAAQYGLSRRESDVFRLLARGYSSPKIQTELYIAQGTVNFHTRNIYAKLGVHSKQELIDLVRASADATRAS